MSHCQKCNTQLPVGARFCAACGSAQLPGGWLTAGAAPGTQEAAAAIQDTVTIMPDTPPISPVVSLNPTRTIHPDTKQPTLPEETGSNTLNPTNSETSQQNSGDIEALTKSGELEISKDMISETPKPSTG